MYDDCARETCRAWGRFPEGNTWYRSSNRTPMRRFVYTRRLK